MTDARSARPGENAAGPDGFASAGADRLLAALRPDGPAGSGSAPDGARSTSGAGTPAGPGTAGAGTAAAPAGMDELALRRLMHDAVRAVEPRSDALDRLTRAVPARRARRRQAMVGAAAGVLLVGTAMPAVLHATRPASDTTGNVNAAGGLSPGGSAAGHRGTGPAGPAAVPPAGSPAPGATPGPLSSAPAASSGSVTAPATGGSSLTGTPPCVRTQLGGGSAQIGTPDASGRVYGSFRVVNVSASSCAVTGPSEISVTTQGGTDPAHIQVVDHTAGDPAAELPDPDQEPAAVILPPGQAYQVQFAWIPAPGGGATGCPATTTPPPDDSGAGGTDADGGSGDSAGGTSNAPDTPSPAANPMDGADGGTASSSPGDGDGGTGTAPPPPASGDGIALANTPPEGGPAAASTDISGACAGTVYQTDPMPTP